MRRTVVCVATTERYRRGGQRLMNALMKQAPPITPYYRGTEPEGCPPHAERPYAFKAYAMKEAADEGAELILWADACMLPIRSMEPLWEKIETDGYWICRNGWTNYEWTAESAYRDLFKPEIDGYGLDEFPSTTDNLGELRLLNKKIPHVVATCFGLNLQSLIGCAFLAEYFRLASETRAFCGPWTNGNKYEGEVGPGKSLRCYPCGPSDVLGHRHDQTAASVIAWRLGMKLTDAPEIFAYGKAGDKHDERTILLADGSYE